MISKISNHIYTIPDSDPNKKATSLDESYDPKNDIENKLTSKIAEIVCEAMDVSSQDRRIVQSLLIASLSDRLHSRYRDPGLLQQYLAHELENLASRVKGELNIPKEVPVDHSHANHSKFSSIVKYIKQNYYTDTTKVFDVVERGGECDEPQSGDDCQGPRCEPQSGG